jgi:4-amino-4-deoxy-L-arabinose transferase-like glycosyltransferase
MFHSLLKQKDLLWILLLALVVRLVYFLVIAITNPDGFYVYDSYGYWQLAENLRTSGVFSQSFSAPLQPDYYRTPLYPLFILFAEIIQIDTLPVITLQILLSLATVYYTYQLAQLLLQNKSIAVIAALIMALDIPSIVFSNLIMTETLFSTLLISGVFYFVKYTKTSSIKNLIVSSVFIGLALLCRPIGIFLPFFFALFTIVFFWHQKGKAILHSVLSLAVVLLTISPWLIRNKLEFNRYFLSVISAHNFQNFQAAVIYAEVLEIPINDARCTLRWKTFQEFEGDANTQPYEYAKHIQKDAFSILFEYPKILLRNHAEQLLHFFIKPTRNYIDVQLGYVKNTYDGITKKPSMINHLLTKSSKLTIGLVGCQLIVLALIYVSSLFSIITFKKNKMVVCFLFFILLILCFANLTIPNVTEARFRIPVMPFIAILSASGVFILINKIKNKAQTK